MNRFTLPVDEIIVQDRQRDDDREAIANLAESIKRIGLIQPIVINQDKRLIAGQQRLAAHRLLGCKYIDVVYKETLTEDDLQEMELTENVVRKNLKWQDECVAIAKIHALKVRRAALDSKPWGQRDTGALIGVNQASICYSLIVAKELLHDTTKSGPFWKAENFNEAYALLIKRDEDKNLAYLASLQGNIFEATSAEDVDHVKDWSPTFSPIKDVDAACSICAGKDVNCLSCGGTGYARDEAPKVPLYSRFVKGDSIPFMLANGGRFNHVITDIPFGIDIDYLDQHVGIKNIDDIRDEHTVEGNLELHAQFFPAAFNCLKDEGFCITWCDLMQWQRMYDLAVATGFKVTRWPFVWCKSHPCLNQMAQYNFTKSTEFAMICRKGNITLPQKQQNNYILAERDALSENHPFAKPFVCWERLIEAVSIENQSILDPFVGSGSCFISGIRLKRIMHGVEKDEKLFNAGLEYVKQFYLTLNPKITFV